MVNVREHLDQALAVAVVAGIVACGPSVVERHNHACELILAGENAEAEAILREVLVERDDMVVRLNLAMAVLEQGRIDEAEWLFDGVHDWTEDGEDVHMKSKIGLGFCAMDRGAPVEAERWFREAGDQEDLAISLDAQGRYAESVPIWREIAENSQEAVDWVNLAAAMMDAGAPCADELTQAAVLARGDESFQAELWSMLARELEPHELEALAEDLSTH